MKCFSGDFLRFGGFLALGSGLSGRDCLGFPVSDGGAGIVKKGSFMGEGVLKKRVARRSRGKE